MAPQTRDLRDSLRLDEYRPTPYREEVWPVVSDERADSVFRPAEFEKVAEGQFEVDAMFSDFSTLPKDVIELSKDAGEFDLTPSDAAINLDPDGDSESPENEISENGSAHELEDIAPAQEDRVSPSRVEGQSVDEIELFESQAGLEHEEESGNFNTQGETAEDELRISQAKLEEALEQAYQKGLADNAEQVRQIHGQLEERYTLLWEDMQTQLSESIAIQERKSVELAMLVAKRLLGDVVEIKREYIIGVIKEAFRAAGDSKVIEARVSPADYEFLRLGEYGAPNRIVSGEKLNFVSDESIKAGCILHTTSGVVDLDLDRAWTRINEKVSKDSQS